MSIVTTNGQTLIKPTRWKWFTAAGLTLLMAIAMPELVLLFVVAGFLALTGLGAFHTITMDRDGFSYRSGAGRKVIAWAQAHDFGVRTVRVNGFASAKLITFSTDQSRSTISGKLARVLTGGTHSMPVMGAKPETVLALMNYYQAGRVPADTVAESSGARADVSPRPAPAWGNLQSAPNAKPVSPPRSLAPPAIHSPAPRASTRPVLAGNPLVKDGFWRKKQTRSWPEI